MQTNQTVKHRRQTVRKQDELRNLLFRLYPFRNLWTLWKAYPMQGAGQQRVRSATRHTRPQHASRRKPNLAGSQEFPWDEKNLAAQRSGRRSSQTCPKGLWLRPLRTQTPVLVAASLPHSESRCRGASPQRPGKAAAGASKVHLRRPLLPVPCTFPLNVVCLGALSLTELGCQHPVMGKMASSPTPLHRSRLNNGTVGSPFPLASWEDDDPQDEFTSSMVKIGRIYVNLSFCGLMEGLTTPSVFLFSIIREKEIEVKLEDLVQFSKLKEEPRM
ncbi:uncharacterized protein LOC144287639 [Canis aureus]